MSKVKATIADVGDHIQVTAQAVRQVGDKYLILWNYLDADGKEVALRRRSSHPLKE